MQTPTPLTYPNAYRIVIAPFYPWVEGEVIETLTGRSVFVTRLQLTAQEAREACEEWIEEQAD
jgi:hypothetical protein